MLDIHEDEDEKENEKDDDDDEDEEDDDFEADEIQDMFIDWPIDCRIEVLKAKKKALSQKKNIV